MRAGVFSHASELALDRQQAVELIAQS